MEANLKYLKLLSKQFPTISSVTTEIMNLEAILNLPKGTEHFVSDLHGEYDAFEHVLRNGSGNVKRKVQDLYEDSLSADEIDELATLIYYPEEKMEVILQDKSKEEKEQWYRLVLPQLVDITIHAASKYTRSKVRKAIPSDYEYILSELLFRDPAANKKDYYNEIISSMIELDRADDFVVTLGYLIQRLVVDHLHVVGDIYDRGPHPEKIIDRMKSYHSLDIQWGNHDVLWMGAALGSKDCVANVIRICARYDNLEIIEDAYGISLRHLISFAERVYTSTNCSTFVPKADPYKDRHYADELEQLCKLQQAIAVIQFKLEKQAIDRNPDFEMEDRLLLHQIDFDQGIIQLRGEEYDMVTMDFPTVDPDNPYELTEEENQIMTDLSQAFMNSEQLQDHIHFMIEKGSMYLVYNDNLLFHGCMPMTKEGDFLEFHYHDEIYSGKALFDFFEQAIRDAVSLNKGCLEHTLAADLIWYLWSGAVSPLFGKHAMTTFERYYIEEKETWTEHKNKYYKLRETEEGVNKILNEFNCNGPNSHIINGHTPIKEKSGENPIKANNRMLVIDGGFSKAYQGKTGIGGYTLLYNSYGMELAVNQPFSSRQDAVKNHTDIVSTKRVVDKDMERQKVADTDIGEQLREESKDLKILLDAYRTGRLAPKR
ncbi:MAG: fructose-1,6-bisphosphatase [Atopococcus tabaci]|uniref:Fructose-1,6-bisphosphatase class 3 n=1 Tax=Atopococcus tabaci TaxID=269774 RepID=A0AA43UCC5_9LACT|nr:fructose-1,6-bisphosphatase [Atopococcus tabaci]